MPSFSFVPSSIRSLGFVAALFGLVPLVTTAATPVDAAYRSILRDARVSRALEQIRAQDDLTLKEQIEITQTPAPSFKETVRANDYARRLRELGLTDVSIDSEGNVIGVRKGARRHPLLLLTAHIDTVFPEGTDVTVRHENGRYTGKGITDDARGLAANLAVLRALQDNRIATVGDILFVGTVGEEGLGNLRGVKALLRDHPEADGFISVDGVMMPEDAKLMRATIVTQATGSRRWKITFTGPGGHSFQNFGMPSAIHAMGRAIAHISELHTTADPKTTFTVGTVTGGTAVNAIAPEASMQIDMRSNDAAALADLEKRVMAAIDAGAAEENARWGSKEMRVTRELQGDRPTGSASNDSPIVHAAVQAWRAVGQSAVNLATASTDSNVPIWLGVPALTLDAGGVGDKPHSPDEWFEPTQSWLGPQSVMLTVLALVGVDGVSKPVLPNLPARKASPAAN